MRPQSKLVTYGVDIDANPPVLELGSELELQREWVGW